MTTQTKRRWRCPRCRRVGVIPGDVPPPLMCAACSSKQQRRQPQAASEVVEFEATASGRDKTLMCVLGGVGGITLLIVLALVGSSNRDRQTHRDRQQHGTSENRESGRARKYTIVANDDLSIKALTKRLSAYQPGELQRLLTNVRKRYRILVPSDISRDDLKATLIQVVKDETSRNPDIDEIMVFAFDRKEDVSQGYFVAQLEWSPNGDWGSMTPEIARTNDRSTYKFKIDIKGRVGDPSGRPTEREFRIHDALHKELFADPDAPEEEAEKKVAARLNMTVDELHRIWLKVTVYKIK